ncbi:jerky protein homolog-like [Microplitis demolitor]|uniref:jerky protein homolog-like n=1 Tax=Microplitis demolitor TaxID=69319 RepID=UPI0004CD88EF|nr:jerky protein homolog-like [Microplitis demolitor]
MSLIGKRKKSVSIDLNIKLKALNEIKNGMSKSAIAKDLGVHKATISSWIKNEKLINEWQDKNNGDVPKGVKRMKKPDYELVDQAVWIWFQERRRAGCPITGVLTKAQALLYAKMLDDKTEFTASQGWLDKWKKRHGVRKIVVSGEKLSANHQAADDYQQSFSEMIAKEELTADQIFNCDESGLIFRNIPRVTLSAKNESAAGFKVQKERVTIMACSNASGTLKFPIVLIGKSMKPSAIQKLSHIPVSYKSQKSAWMTGPLFEKWFYDEFVPRVTEFLQSKGLPIKAVLFVDICGSHPQNLKKGGIRVEFLPPYTTSLIQPMDQGCLQSLKMNYRVHLMSFLLSKLDDGLSVIEALKQITMKEVIFWVSDAWNAVSQTTIIKSWKQLWPQVETILRHFINSEKSSVNQVGQINTQDVVKNFCEKFSESNDHENNLAIVTEWMNTTAMSSEDYLTDEQILQAVQDDKNEDDQDENENTTNRQPPDWIALRDSINFLLNHCEGNRHYQLDWVTTLKTVRKAIESEMTMWDVNFDHVVLNNSNNSSNI